LTFQFQFQFTEITLHMIHDLQWVLKYRTISSGMVAIWLTLALGMSSVGDGLVLHSLSLWLGRPGLGTNYKAKIQIKANSLFCITAISLIKTCNNTTSMKLKLKLKLWKTVHYRWGKFIKWVCIV